SLVAILRNLPLHSIGFHALLPIRFDPADRIRSMTKQVGGFLNPRVRSGGCVDPQSFRALACKSGLSYVPVDPRAASREETYAIGYVAAADHQASAVHGIADEFRNPPDGLRLNLSRRWSQLPRADIWIDGRREQIGKDPDGRRTCSDVAK